MGGTIVGIQGIPNQHCGHMDILRDCVVPLEITGRSMCTIHSPQHAQQTGTMQPRCNRAHSSIQLPFSSSFLLSMMETMMLTGPAVSEGGSDNWHHPLLMSQVLSPTQCYCTYQGALDGTNCRKFSALFQVQQEIGNNCLEGTRWGVSQCYRPFHQ